ncbi:hypothetical protein [Nocardia tenerifensis]|nr:hypothetical protein [Nocardia tenerifensis]
MGTDITNVAVAAITAISTLGGTIAAQFFALRSKRLDTEIQSRERVEDRRETARKDALDEKRSLYAELSTSAHYFRTAGRRYLAEKAAGSADPSRFDAAWENFREGYARAQMVLSDRAIFVTSEVSRCIDAGYQAALDVSTGSAERITAIDTYLNKDVGFATRTLRHALREDVGIELPAHVDLDDRVAELERMRHNLSG